ncbi:sodium:alanine symporter family protein [Schaedlerella arabinosiphila]|uniref:Sodium:alanine symporter family protein n=1 Tax=Schaedlerella arabinosiphila TaxID=2044587 RepID=A0A9X5C899_9FIRM|nr:sodium:alanine symporter family protein [Schaedlerella arabinosiphila]KAI4440633.1 Amino-acid carrier protein AlsT [Schaedlerella arabinosiphila]MCI9602673.1 sodium:alanine symporter family protein [Ruminococcus sp.]NDO69515.1 sodium:alanine symporter family protein [Schaedlerella arabinosiphila]
MSCIAYAVQSLQRFLWSMPMLVILLGTHIYFTVRLHVIQRKIPQGIRLSVMGTDQSRKKGDAPREDRECRGGNVSPFSALATSLAATIGTGNIIGISTAVAIGGPGAVFWCWITGVLGIATCYAECYLSVRYRMIQEDGTYRGGPMYVMEHVLHQKSAAVLFAFSVILVSLGMGSSVQSHSIAAAVLEQKEMSSQVIGITAALLTGIVILGGAKQIAAICTWLVPFMSLFYLSGCFLLIWLNRDVLPEALWAILHSAFSSRSVVGGAAGTAVMTGIRAGISRGLFTNEAGLGSIPMAAASAHTGSPRQQGLVSMTGTFWDTVVMCAITGIAVVSSMVKSPELFCHASPDRLCFLAFSQLDGLFQNGVSGLRIPGGFSVDGSLVLSAALVLFAFATIIGWNFYGECAVRYLWGSKGLRQYHILYISAVYLGAVLSLDLVWTMSDLFNSFMAIPNLLCLWMLREVVIKER